MAEEMITAKDEEHVDEAKTDEQEDTEKTKKDTPSFDDILKDPKMQAEFDRRLSKARQIREEKSEARSRAISKHALRKSRRLPK